MTTKVSVAVANAMVDAVTAKIDGGAGAGTVQIRTGSQPATVAAGATGTLLGTLTLSDPSFGAAASGTATANAVTGDSSADATGTAGWFRVFDSSGTAVDQGDVTATGGGGDMQLDSTSIVAGGTINITSWTMSVTGS